MSPTSLAKTAVKIIPTIPPTPCDGNTSRVSSIFVFLVNLIEILLTIAATDHTNKNKIAM